MSRWANRATTLKYAKELIRSAADDKIVIDREALRQLVKAAESPRSARQALSHHTESQTK